VRVGFVGRSHGTAGAFVVRDPTARLELLEPGKAVSVADRELVIAARKGTAARPIVQLTGVESREAARDLRGEAIEVVVSALEPLGEGEFLVDDLIGCEAFDGERRVGRVINVLLLPSVDALEVEREGAEPLLVPLVADAVRSVDAEARRVDLDLGFLDAD
jgi:16S rRNA processing protein RimM